MQILSFLKESKKIVQQIFTQNIITSSNNKIVYESDDVIKYYVAQNDLQKPEATILEQLRNKLPNMSMLDVGVGAGRTTIHFAPLVKEYLGIDYSNRMINACLEKFRAYPKISFLTSDARTMKDFKNNSFDFVLFSFNGLDYMDNEDRIGTLRDIRRIMKVGGYFCFSTHNLNYLLKKCSIQLSKHPSVFAKRTYQLMQMRLLNTSASWKTIRDPSQYPRYSMVNDGAHNFQLKTYYIKPVDQLKQLKELGFSDTQMYGLNNGMEIKNPGTIMDHWVYYLSKTA